MSVKTMKKWMALVLAVVTVCSMLPLSAAAQETATTLTTPALSSYVTLKIGSTKAIQNGAKTLLDNEGTKPFTISGRTMLPLRFVGEKMGGKVRYISDKDPIVLTYGDKKVEFLLGSKKMTVYDGNKKTVVTLDVAAQKKGGRTYIPLRAVSQALGFQVYYQSGTEYIIVCTPKMSNATRTARLQEAQAYFDPPGLSGRLICLDPGHGTFTQSQASLTEPIAPGSSVRKRVFGGGTTGVATKVPERIYVLDFARQLKTALEKEGAVVIMTRNDEKSITSITRAQIANNAGAEATVRLHCDANNNQSIRGATSYVASDKYVKDAALRKKSDKLGQCVVDAYCTKTGIKNRGLVRYSDFTGNNWSTVPVVLFEMGFMTNPEEDRLMATSAHREKAVAGIINGLKDYFKS